MTRTEFFPKSSQDLTGSSEAGEQPAYCSLRRACSLGTARIICNSGKAPNAETNVDGTPCEICVFAGSQTKAAPAQALSNRIV